MNRKHLKARRKNNINTQKELLPPFGFKRKLKLANTPNSTHVNIKKHNKSKNIDSHTESKANTQPIIPIANVGIMGKPNVGKSSLFNRLLKKQVAITSNISGSTRDINKQNLRLNEFDICIIDTGGLDILDSIGTRARAKQNTSLIQADSKSCNFIPTINQSHIASALKYDISLHSYEYVKQSDIIVYMVDGSMGVDDSDIMIFRELSKQKPAILVLNKVDSDKIALDTHDFMSFGVEFIMISVSNNRGITKLITTIESTIQKLINTNQLQKKRILVDDKKISLLDSSLHKSFTAKQNLTQSIGLDPLEYYDRSNEKIYFSMESNQEEIPQIHVGIIGRPNVGKSSILNAITKTNRSLVSNVAGTTTDPVNESIIHDNKQITFVDTAGIRRRSKINGIEKYALDRTQKILQECDIALLVLDSSMEFVELDEKISSIAIDNSLGIIVLLNKWDIRCKEYTKLKENYSHKFRFLEYAPIITVSAATNRHIYDIKQKIIEVYNNFSYRIPTARLNECIQEAIKKHPIPSDHGKFIKIYYATQFDTKPPRIALMMNKTKLHFSYQRYLVNTIKTEFKLLGTPIILELRDKNKDDANPN
ncbi:ribosome biogenesis GTPase Der [Helicobacter muridarum]|uniref:GTPase Der n=1 Tax=Helicobacter muridarum TaxID=216 RepID=A0A377PRM6_9HELI|nr:ribosome biogenesis GTPase Der [Helicobacter muridarum]TLE00621.1 ribosome biogenesis GTPase Der [Helicobacter muridarum]STQ85638.1 GTP-binding protein Der [Helicobacter muridarum]